MNTQTIKNVSASNAGVESEIVVTHALATEIFPTQVYATVTINNNVFNDIEVFEDEHPGNGIQVGVSQGNDDNGEYERMIEYCDENNIDINEVESKLIDFYKKITSNMDETVTDYRVGAVHIIATVPSKLHSVIDELLPKWFSKLEFDGVEGYYNRLRFEKMGFDFKLEDKIRGNPTVPLPTIDEYKKLLEFEGIREMTNDDFDELNSAISRQLGYLPDI